MSTRYPDLFAALAAPFHPSELKTRTQSGRQLTYITARTAMNRLDMVLGPENWCDRYIPGEKSVLCELTITLPDGSKLMKSDAGGYAGMADSGDDDKSGYSDAFKRAAVKFGVSRYLYGDGVPDFSEVATPAPAVVNPPPGKGEAYEGDLPPAPAPNNLTPRQKAQQAQQARQPQQPSNGHGGPPRTGKALFAWTKDQEQRYGVGLLKYLNSWAKLQDFPGRMVDWDADQVALAHAEAVRKLGSIQSNRHDGYEEALAN